MDVQAIITAISTVGFPIVTAAALFWYMVEENRQTREVVQNNTTMLNRILEHLVEDEKRDKDEQG